MTLLFCLWATLGGLGFLGVTPGNQPVAINQSFALDATGAQPFVNLLAGDAEQGGDLAGGEFIHCSASPTAVCLGSIVFPSNDASIPVTDNFAGVDPPRTIGLPPSERAGCVKFGASAEFHDNVRFDECLFRLSINKPRLDLALAVSDAINSDCNKLGFHAGYCT